MRMWLCDPKIMCQKHLCGEHLEMHMFLDSLKKKKKITGYLNNNLFEPRLLFVRHEFLAVEMLKRKYKHKSPLDERVFEYSYMQLPYEEKNVKIDRQAALKTLLDRCPECRKRYTTLTGCQPLAST
jgi:hypothetical protein